MLIKSRALSEAAKATKVLKANLKGFPPELLYEKKVDGKTAAERVLADRVSGGSMGKAYWQTLRDMYSDEASVAKRLKVQVEGQFLDAQLEKASASGFGEVEGRVCLGGVF